jgi:hypothetical protein
MAYRVLGRLATSGGIYDLVFQAVKAECATFARDAAREALEQEADRFERALGTGEWSRADVVRALRERAAGYGGPS